MLTILWLVLFALVSVVLLKCQWRVYAAIYCRTAMGQVGWPMAVLRCLNVTLILLIIPAWIALWIYSEMSYFYDWVKAQYSKI